MTWMLLGWVRLRWPMSAAACAASRRTAVPPSRPATQASESASRLSSCSRATLTCSIRLPCGNQLVERIGVAGTAHGLAQRLVGKHLRQLRQALLARRLQVDADVGDGKDPGNECHTPRLMPACRTVYLCI